MFTSNRDTPETSALLLHPYPLEMDLLGKQSLCPYVTIAFGYNKLDFFFLQEERAVSTTRFEGSAGKKR